eukprot:COSAG06_NODE_10330_length_1701_cov_1.552434_1_plen_89_part_00
MKRYHRATRKSTICRGIAPLDFASAALSLYFWDCLGYKVIMRGAYKTAQNRSDPDEVFFGQWARKECTLLVFIMLITHLSAVRYMILF